MALIAKNAATGGGGQLTAVPEPASIVLLGIGALAIAFCRRSRKSGQVNAFDLTGSQTATTQTKTWWSHPRQPESGLGGPATDR